MLAGFLQQPAAEGRTAAFLPASEESELGWAPPIATTDSHDAASSVPPRVEILLANLSSENSIEKIETLQCQLRTELASLSSRNLPAVLKAYEQAGVFKSCRYIEFFALIDAWSHFDTYAALDYSLKTVGGDLGNAVVINITAEFEPSEIMSYFWKQPEMLRQQSMHRMLEYQEAARSYEAGDVAKQLPSLDPLSHLLLTWAKADPDAARNWIAAETKKTYNEF